MFTKYKWGVTNRSMGDPKKLYQPEYLTQYRWRLPHSWVDGAPPLLSLPCLYTRTHPKNQGHKKIMADLHINDEGVKGELLKHQVEVQYPS